jgi:prephenate dehydratase/chorismate mutase/prephenate dehydratase
MNVAFQGEPGAYSHEAAQGYFGPDAQISPCRTFREVFEAIEVGGADAGLLPIENSLTGSIHEVYDLLREYPHSIVGEVFLSVEHRLLGPPGAALGSVERVYSHPQALWQCERFLSELNAETHAFYDTAGAAKWVSQQDDPRYAAIAGRLAAQLYGLETLREYIATYDHNTTRFIVVRRAPGRLDHPAGGLESVKTSLVVELKHEPGALYRALGIFAERGINLTKLESRPLRTEKWRYRFYLDFEGHRDAPNVREALRELERQAAALRVLGSYPSGLERRTS